ncbi:MAG: ATP-dependent DNA helicase RecG [Clostridium sp.]|nr:ATP-dependent DNA helicase RecG [Clostridium sp.]
MEIYSDVDVIKGVGEKTKQMLNKCSIFSVMDLLLYFPRDYETLIFSSNISEFSKGDKVIVKGRFIRNDGSFRSRNGKTITKLLFTDGKNIFQGIWFNMPYISKSFQIDNEYTLMGKINILRNEISMTSPVVLKDESKREDKIVPIYPLRDNMKNKYFINIISKVLSAVKIEENLPEWIVKKHNFYSLDRAIRCIHNPTNISELNEAKRRLKFQELFTYSLKVLVLKDYVNKGKKGIAYKMSKELVNLKESLPYKLTGAQSRSIREILIDEKKPTSMNRLLQGDVGSGKTIVAFIAMFNVIKNGFQAALLVPTEILAFQHYEDAKKLLESFNINIGILTGSTSAKKKREIKENIKNGTIQMLVGTHALLEDDVEFEKLGMVVTDEQHRFGVMQRSRLFNKGSNIDILVMTATPIPRTLGLYLYGDLDVSVIDELPPTRKKVDTNYCDIKEEAKVYEFAREEVQKGRQVYIVCPLVEENEKMELASAKEMSQKLKEKYFKDFTVDLMYGKMPPKDKEEIMLKFKEGKTSILVSTTVVEVGVNVPNATVMIVENAERFGLSQLHQLRGRVGRGEFKSYCFLIASIKGKNVKRRMEIMKNSNDGFYIAREDLKIRGSGEIFGFRQHGENGLILADIISDSDILIEASSEARNLIQSKNSKDIHIKNHILERLHQNSRYICFN